MGCFTAFRFGRGKFGIDPFAGRHFEQRLSKLFLIRLGKSLDLANSVLERLVHRYLSISLTLSACRCIGDDRGWSVQFHFTPPVPLPAHGPWLPANASVSRG